MVLLRTRIATLFQGRLLESLSQYVGEMRLSQANGFQQLFPSCYKASV